MEKLTKEELKGMNKKQLYDYCRANGIKGYSNMNKAYITDLILNFYKSGQTTKRPVKKKSILPKKTENKIDKKEVLDRMRKSVDKVGDIREYPDLMREWKSLETNMGLFARMYNEGVDSVNRGKSVPLSVSILMKNYKRNTEVSINKILSELKKRNKPKKPSKKLKLYNFGSSIRTEGIGDVSYIIVTTSKKEAISRIVKVDIKRSGSNWISQRIYINDDVNFLPTDLRKIKGFNPWNTPDILYMIETDKLVGHIISPRATPKIVKMWNVSGELKKVSTINYNLSVKKPVKKFKNFDEFFDWFKYNVAIDLKIAIMNDWRKNENFKTGEEYIEVFKDYDFKKVKDRLKNVENIEYEEDINYQIYFRKNKKTIKKPIKKAKDTFDKFYDKTGAEVYQFSVSIEDGNENIMDIIDEKASKVGFTMSGTHLTEIDHKEYGYQPKYKLKKPKPISRTLLKKIERLVNPVRKDLYDSSVRYKSRYVDGFFYGTKVDNIEDQIKRKLN